ncbi:MAG: CPBP family intramembrane metalloprotease [Lachnospiraceae bacterium]|nr:CPBP family intramembrane metalloprotease [Lachnospiraceae bacterium]
MIKVKNFLKNSNPFKAIEENSKLEYVIQKVLGFGFIYAISAFVMEGIIILIFTCLGYDLLHGEMPSGVWVKLLPLYGFAGFGVNTLLYVKFIEKRKLSSILLYANKRSLFQFVYNFIVGFLLVGVMIGILIITGNYKFAGFGRIDIVTLILGLSAYIIQGSVEEIMCRGFLQNTLCRKIGMAGAVIISSMLFIAPHIMSIIRMERLLVYTSIINLVFVSFLFSLAMIKDNSIAASCGIHIGWNFALDVICGLQVSGKEASNGIIKFSNQSGYDWITGGNYGIEASVILILVLAVLNVIYLVRIKRKRVNNGI